MNYKKNYKNYIRLNDKYIINNYKKNIIKIINFNIRNILLKNV